MSLTKSELVVACPICLETMKSPIKQCKTGHSMCGECVDTFRLDKCPTCRGPMSTTRNYQLEQVIEGINKTKLTTCIYTNDGCNYKFSPGDKESHEKECRFRRFVCEGKTFASWKCNWTGNFTGILEHFKEVHKEEALMEYRTEANMKISLKKNYTDVKVISFFSGQQLFYYKHKVDVAKQKVFWAFQLIGLSSQAKNYYYEFEICDNVRKFKVTEICLNDTFDVNKIFESEKCVAISFQSIKNFLDKKGEITFKFRIMAIRKATVSK